MTQRSHHNPRSTHRSYPAWQCCRISSALLFAIAVCIGAVPNGFAQTVYKVTDKDGNVTFTDTPPSDQEAVVEAQTVHSPNTSAAVTPAPIDESDDATVTEPISYETLIVSPAEAATIPMGPGNFSVDAIVRPALSQGERVVLTLDGEPVGTPQRMTTWQLTNVYRGEHRLQVVRVNAEGARVNASSERTVYVMRPIANR